MFTAYIIWCIVSGGLVGWFVKWPAFLPAILVLALFNYFLGTHL